MFLAAPAAKDQGCFERVEGLEISGSHDLAYCLPKVLSVYPRFWQVAGALHGVHCTDDSCEVPCGCGKSPCAGRWSCTKCGLKDLVLQEAFVSLFETLVHARTCFPFCS